MTQEPLTVLEAAARLRLTREFADAQFTATGTRPSDLFKQEIIVGTAALSSRVMVTDGFGNVQRDFFAFDPLYTGGVTVAAASVDKRRDDGFAFLPGQQDTASYDEVIVGASSRRSCGCTARGRAAPTWSRTSSPKRCSPA